MVRKRSPSPKRRRHVWKNAKQIESSEHFELYHPSIPTYASIRAPVSILPTPKYCDLTGELAPYTHPRTQLRYSRAELHNVIEGMGHDQVNHYLRIRKAERIIK